MDRNSLIGLGIIAAILGAWLYFSAPSKEQLAARKRIKDSLALIEHKRTEEIIKAEKAKTLTDTASKLNATILSDSIKSIQFNEKYKDFAVSAKGTDSYFTIENEKLKATILNRGAQIVKVELKEYKRYGKTEPLVLFDKDSTSFALKLNAYQRSRVFSTDSFYFTSVKSEKNQITLQLQTSKPGSYIEINYTLNAGSYLVNSSIKLVGMQTIISDKEEQIQLNWAMLLPTQEKHIVKEREAATIYYKQADNSPDYINPGKEDTKELNDADIKWVSFKQQFFNSTIIAKTNFLKSGSYIKTGLRPNSEAVVKSVATEMSIPFSGNASEKFDFDFYFGPNHYSTLKAIGNDMEKIIPTGWSVFSVINKWLVIPLFNGLGTLNMGLVILILTLIVKLLLSPIAYKTYLSGARMRLLKPEIDQLNAKFEKNADPIKKQQEQMALYNKAGVNPLSGCFPLLLQFPILIALFAFIPAAIELRQKNFLWADDLSTYDSIWHFGNIPVISSIYGDHVSLFAALMFVSTIIYTYMNSNMMATPQSNQMPGMKFMMYFMPVIFLAVMNRYSAGLSWYYFLANMFTFSQNYIIKLFIKDSTIRTQLEENMKKPKKKGGFAQRLEEMARQRQQQVNSAKGKK
ncbi:MAG: membrane protein insertase YidC [Bacteroidetes bacterium]|nr:membrane protein insertase YidC [Bacteroidota bacterium]